jgi:hypothetical protein
MGSSPGFASATPDSLALLRLAFATAPPLKGLTWPDTATRRIIMQKARGQAGLRQGPPTACRRGVSGSVSSPDRGSSHRSVALLGSLSVVIEYLALRDGPRGFRPGFPCPTLLGYRIGGSSLRLRDCHPLWCHFPKAFGSLRPIPCFRPHNPRRYPAWFGLVPVRSPLLGESRLISSPPGTEMFQFPGSSRAFRARRSLGSSPGLFAASHARILMTPRHPPRALRSLTTPRGPPRRGTDAGPINGPHSLTSLHHRFLGPGLPPQRLATRPEGESRTLFRFDP